MDVETRAWLCGQITAIRVLAKDVSGVLHQHNEDAESLLDGVTHLCNRAEAILHEDDKVAEQEGTNDA